MQSADADSRPVRDSLRGECLTGRCHFVGAVDNSCKLYRQRNYSWPSTWSHLELLWQFHCERPGSDDLAGQRAAWENHLHFQPIVLDCQGHSDRVRTQAASVETGLALIQNDTSRLCQHDFG